MRMVTPGELNAPVRVTSAPVMDPAGVRAPTPTGAVVPTPPFEATDGAAAPTPTALETAFGAARPRSARAPGRAPDVAVTRTSEAPVMDGIVDDASWALADVASDFLQREPQEGQPASERTEVRVLYDDENLYVGVIAYDSNPSAVLATEMRRDARGLTIRRIRRHLQHLAGHLPRWSQRLPVHRERTRHPLRRHHSQRARDQLRLGRGLGGGAAQVTSRGWEAELVIPLGILRFSSGMADWGVDFERQIRHKNEQVAWSNYRRDFRFIAVSQAGDLRGFENLSVTQRFRVPALLSGRHYLTIRRPRSHQRRYRPARHRRLQDPDHVEPDRRPHLQHRFRAGRSRSATRQPDALLALFPREARLLPRRGQQLQLRPATRRWLRRLRSSNVASLPLAQHRPVGLRASQRLSTSAPR